MKTELPGNIVSGERGIRTLGGVTLGRLASAYHRPLGHLSGTAVANSRQACTCSDRARREDSFDGAAEPGGCPPRKRRELLDLAAA